MAGAEEIGISLYIQLRCGLSYLREHFPHLEEMTITVLGICTLLYVLLHSGGAYAPLMSFYFLN